MSMPTNRYVSVLSVALLGLVALLSSPKSASAAAIGASAGCSFTTTTRLQCNIPVLSSQFNAEIHYVTVGCSSTGVAYNLQQLELLAIPPNGTTVDIAYQTAGNRGSVAGVVNTGEIVDVPVKIDTTSEVVIELSPAPTGTTSCTASIMATY
jgi:hypothetical protein